MSHNKNVKEKHTPNILLHFTFSKTKLLKAMKLLDYLLFQNCTSEEKKSLSQGSRFFQKQIAKPV